MPNHLRLVVDLELDSSPISGQLASDQQTPRPFQGWLELASAIETLRTSATKAHGQELANAPHPPPSR